MSTGREKTLQAVLVVVGLVFLAGIYPLMQVWPSGWQWKPPQAEYELMIVGVYATLGVFLLLAAREPRRHRSLIAFTAWSSLVHGGIMLIQALMDRAELGHLAGDVPALIVVGVALLWLMPPQPAAEGASATPDSAPGAAQPAGGGAGPGSPAGDSATGGASGGPASEGR